MNTPQPAAAKHAPARAPREPDEETAGEETLPHHAKRLVWSRLSAMVGAILDPVIALLQGWRKGAGGAGDNDARGDEDRPRSRKGRPGEGHESSMHGEDGEEAAEAPKPKRRLLTYLIYFSVLLGGCMVGGALAYELLARMLERQAAESERLVAAMAKQSKSTASNAKKLEEALAKRVEAEKKLEEAKKKQAEAEKKLETALTDTKAATEKQKKLDDAVKLLEQIRGPDRSGTAAPRSPPVSGNAERRQPPPKSGDCKLAAGNVNALKDCVSDFNR